ncbi:MAG: acyl-CoA dehydrogenase family protein, partial [Rhizobiales bacterium]|nr:acyl-CoA dehydrogenase family protein [Hyphomicrobiales bacterium]
MVKTDAEIEHIHYICSIASDAYEALPNQISIGENEREAVRKLCAQFPGDYWRRLDAARGYPTEFVRSLTEAGYLAVLIPEAYGGAGLPLSAAAAILEVIHAEGCNGAACHAQMYTMGTVLRHGSEAQKAAFLPAIARGELRLQAFGVTE